jgi:hypothetical protein
VLRPTKKVAFGHGGLVRGALRNAAGQPIADAELRLLVRELKLGSHDTDRGAITTTGDGRFSFSITRGSSRRVHAGSRRMAPPASGAASAAARCPRAASPSSCRPTNRAAAGER